MKRRTFLGIVAAASLAARAQQPGKVYRVGILESIPAAQNGANVDALRNGLRELGYVEGRNLAIEYRSSDGDAARFPALASELVRLDVDVIVTRGTPATAAARKATATIPVVMATMGDPGALVTSFARPGANVTGLTTFSTELTGKRIELLHELAPRVSRIGLLHNMANPAAHAEWEEAKTAARALGARVELFDVRNARDIARAFADAPRRGVDAFVVGFDGLTQMQRQAIVDAMARDRLPAVYPAREFVDAGGLLAYAVNYPDLYYRFAGYVDKILKGAKPADLPIEQPTRFELAINLRTARVLDIAVPQSLLLRADHVLR